MAVSYDDEFIRQDGRWLIARTMSRRMSMTVSDVGEDGVPHVIIAGRSDNDDPAPAPRTPDVLAPDRAQAYHEQ